MKPIAIKTAAEQVADHLRSEFRAGTWSKWLPGEGKLATDLSIGRKTISGAMRILEKEGWLQPTGQGKRRRITNPEGVEPMRNLRIKILLYEREDRGLVDNADLLTQLQEAWFSASFASKSLKDLGMNVERVARFVEQNPADAWVVSAASKEVNQWFSQQPFPALAMYGRTGGLRMASASTVHSISVVSAARRLIELGHKRIVMIAREEWRKPKLGVPEQLFINELVAAGISTSDYNFPEWKETCDGLLKCMDELFRVSPPTAIIFQESPLFIAARSYLAYRGIIAPRDVH